MSEDSIYYELEEDAVEGDETPGKSDEELLSILESHVYRGLNDEGGDVSDIREKTLSRYRGESVLEERDGYSKLNSRETFETIEWALPLVLKPFVSGDRVVEFEPVDQDDEAQAEQETDVVNYYALKRNNGFTTLYSAVKDALMYPNGYLKVYQQERARRTFERYTGLLPVQLAEIDANPEFTIIEAESNVEHTDLGPVELYNIRVQRDWIERKKTWEPVPPDELIVAEDLTELDLDEADFLCHRVRKNFSQLVREGFDPELLESVGETSDHDNDSERHHRLNYIDDNPDRDDDMDESMREMWVHECYLWVDADNDGIAEYRNIVFVGNTIFHNEEVDYQPFVASASIINTHRHIGMSLAEAIEDLEKYSTQLKRALIDNANKANVPRKYVGEGALDHNGMTLDMLLNTRSEYIPVGDPTQIVPEQHQSVIGEILPALAQLSEDRKMRTGIAPELNMDPNVLQQSTAEAFMGALEQTSQRVELLTRIIAETLVKKLFQKWHSLMRMHPDPAATIKLRSDYIPVDPTQWRERTNVNINVGLGFKGKQEQIQTIMGLLQVQREAMSGNMVGPEHFWHSFDKLVEAVGYRETEMFFRRPEDIPPPPDPKESPEYQLIMAEAEESRVQAQKLLAEAEEERNSTLREKAETAAKLQAMGHEIANTDADTDLKVAQAAKARAEANAPKQPATPAR